MLTNNWQKSSYSSNQDCVEVRAASDGDVELRDSDYPEAGTIKVTGSQWNAFIRGVKAGQFDLLEAN